VKICSGDPGNEPKTWRYWPKRRGGKKQILEKIVPAQNQKKRPGPRGEKSSKKRERTAKQTKAVQES